MHQLLILTPDAEQYERLIRERRLPGLKISLAKDVESGQRNVAEAEIILGAPGLVRHLLGQAKKLKWVQSTFAGIDALCAKGLPKNYILTGVKGIFGPLISEYVLAYILALERNLFAHWENQQKKSWEDIPYRSSEGIVVGICGVGSIGKQIARTAKCFGMKVYAYKRSDSPVEGVDKVFAHPGLHEFLKDLDYLVITLPATAETNGLINKEAIDCMKSSATLINVGRGAVVMETALIEALQKKRIRGAVLDVFQQEPLPSESPLWGMPNVLITPHNSGNSFPEDIADIFCDNYDRYAARQRMKFIVDFDKGY